MTHPDPHKRMGELLAKDHGTRRLTEADLDDAERQDRMYGAHRAPKDAFDWGPYMNDGHRKHIIGERDEGHWGRAPIRPTPPRRFAWPSPPILAMLVALGLAVVVWLYAGAAAKAVEAMRNAPDVYGLEGR